jgi:hypothetical protein
MYSSLRSGGFGSRASLSTQSVALVFVQPSIHHSIAARRRFTQKGENRSHIVLALYRQLLRWCDDTEDDIPLSYFIPPVYLKSPQIEEKSLQLLAAGDSESRIKRCTFPPKATIDETQLTCPIHSSVDARSFFRGVFRLNAWAETDPANEKQRIGLAFEGLKSLNELTHTLTDLNERREKHVDRNNVEFRIGKGRIHLFLPCLIRPSF